nr:MAG TPA: hypothetical protein [Caudoviricetes sp.]
MTSNNNYLLIYIDTFIYFHTYLKISIARELLGN